MDRHGVILQLYARAPAPLRDYYGLTISQKEVILNMWNISHGPHVFPKRQKCPLHEFQHSRAIMVDVASYFGDHVLEYCLNLSRRDPKLQCLPTKIFLSILRYLATNDIIRLGQTSKIFFELCNTDAAWKVIFRRKCRRKLSVEEKTKVEISGWRSLVLDLDIKQNGILGPNKTKSVSKSKEFNFNVKKKTGLGTNSNLGAGDLGFSKNESFGRVNGVYRDLESGQKSTKSKEISTGRLVFGAEMERLVMDSSTKSQKFCKDSTKISKENTKTLTAPPSSNKKFGVEIERPVMDSSAKAQKVCKESPISSTGNTKTLSASSSSNKKSTKTTSNAIPKPQIPNRSDYKSIYYKPDLDPKSLSNFKDFSSLGLNFENAVADASNFFENRCNSVITNIRSQHLADKETVGGTKHVKPARKVNFEIDNNFISASLKGENESQRRISNFVTNFRSLNMNDLRYIDEDEEVKSVDGMECLDDGKANFNPFRVDDFVVEQKAAANLKEKIQNSEQLSDLDAGGVDLDVVCVSEAYSGPNLDQGSSAASTFQILDGAKLSLKIKEKPKVDMQKIYANSLTKSRILNYKHGLANRHLFSESERGPKTVENSGQNVGRNLELEKGIGRKSDVNLNEFSRSQVELRQVNSDLEKIGSKSRLKSKTQVNLSSNKTEKNEIKAKLDKNGSKGNDQAKIKQQSKSSNKSVRYAEEVKVIENSGDYSLSKLTKEDSKAKSFLYSLFGAKSKLETMNNAKVANEKDFRFTLNNHLNSTNSKSSTFKMIDNFGKTRRSNVATTAASGDSRRINR